MATQLITLDKFGLETSPDKKRYTANGDASFWYAFLIREAIALRISAKERQSLSAGDCSRPWEKSDGATHVPLRSDGRWRTACSVR